MSLIGVISDTHGLVRPQVAEAFRGVELIIHAGDVGGSAVLEALRGIAPVIAVRGNTDKGPWGETLPATEVVQTAAGNFYVIHDVNRLDISPEVAGMAVVISGHSHKPVVEETGGVTFVNPGSAGRSRFGLPVTVALIEISGTQLKAGIVDLMK